jgi:hypothetical protein
MSIALFGGINNPATLPGQRLSCSRGLGAHLCKAFRCHRHLLDLIQTNFIHSEQALMCFVAAPGSDLATWLIPDDTERNDAELECYQDMIKNTSGL